MGIGPDHFSSRAPGTRARNIDWEAQKMKGDGNGKDKALETTLANLKKRYGEGAIMKLGEAADMRVEAIPTGALSLDLALGVGGLPRAG